jgi:hypothetical protein
MCSTILIHDIFQIKWKNNVFNEFKYIIFFKINEKIVFNEFKYILFFKINEKIICSQFNTFEHKLLYGWVHFTTYEPGFIIYIR